MLSSQGRKSIKKAPAGAECGSVSLRRVINLKRDPSLRTPGNRSTTISDIKRRILLSAPRNPAAGATTRQGRGVGWPEATGHRGQVPGGPREALRGPRRSPKTSHAAAHLGSLTPPPSVAHWGALRRRPVGTLEGRREEVSRLQRSPRLSRHLEEIKQ